MEFVLKRMAAQSIQFRVDAIKATEGATIYCGRCLHATNIQVLTTADRPKHRVATICILRKRLAHCLLRNK